jgi:hypothetical protein
VLGHVHSDAAVQPPHSKKLADPQPPGTGKFCAVARCSRLRGGGRIPNLLIPHPIHGDEDRLIAISSIPQEPYRPAQDRSLPELREDAPCFGQMLKREGTLFLDLVK